ncbi:toll/interleukin-1 receptor domain-containing protein [Bradyrhizobium erythrophlei]|uniref:TIR domain-containing protein n=1 Tax=Bradyrhizobium erythrophlei TaxID=1437360 RepID=A0A1M5I6K2_9BRAD|nr:toll/interleukin-1 receptor domain-containing protein [Bradyrhizobium erythrophlei]SHG23905.1 TIR domain-containing protein [Bradyrhizobium erythrophlei]
MRVFISWSGELSRQLSEAIRDWLPSALQSVRPYFTPSDIDKGARWATEISEALSASKVGIIVLTRDNLRSNWIMFESGAISSTLDKSRICPILFDLEPTDLQGPLAQFQVTRFAEDDFRKLFHTINSQLGEHSLIENVAQAVFDKWWPDLNEELSKIMQGHTAKADVPKIRSDRDLIEEMLLLVRGQAAARSAKYEGSTMQQFAGLLKYVVDEDCWVNADEFSKKLVSLSNFTKERLAEGESKNAVLRDLEELVKRTRPLPGRTRAKLTKPAADDDDIPF